MAIHPIVYLIATFAFGLFMFFLGNRIHRIFQKKHPDGVIFLGKNDDGDDRIVFQLNMEYEEINQHDTVLFNVVREKAL